MNKLVLLGILLAIAVLTAQQAYSAIPPTPAFAKVKIVYDNNAIPSGETEVNAIMSNDDLVFISDGSILFDVTTYP